MPLYIIREDITRIRADAIVNPTDQKLSGRGGLDRQIHDKGGDALRTAVQALRAGGGLDVGQARATVGGSLPCRFVIHAVGPRYKDGASGEREKLFDAYRNALTSACSLGCESVALPLISTGTFAYPLRESFLAAREVALEFVEKHELSVSLVIYQKEALAVSREIVEEIEDRIGEGETPWANDFSQRCESRRERRRIYEESDFFRAEDEPIAKAALLGDDAIPPVDTCSLEDLLGALDESFSEMLLRLIDERGMKDSECYKRANIDRKLFSKIRSDKGYRPSKPTVIAFALALTLSLSETKGLLRAAGFALSGASKFDVIVEYYVTHGVYDVFLINETLFHFDQPLIG